MEDELTLIGVFKVLVESWKLIVAYQNLVGNPAHGQEVIDRENMAGKPWNMTVRKCSQDNLRHGLLPHPDHRPHELTVRAKSTTVSPLIPFRS